jgi:toxin ParE1/3/4
MAKAYFTAEADQGFARIAAYIATDNPPAAFRWVDETRNVCELLAAQPGIGQQVQTKRLGPVRRHAVGNYLIYYRPVTDGVEILHVIHGARDQDRII